MSKWIWLLVGAVTIGPAIAVIGCSDDVRTTKTITTHEEDPVRMVSPGTEIVE